MTFLPNGAAEEEENDSDEHEEEDEEEISIHGDVAVYLYQVLWRYRRKQLHWNYLILYQLFEAPKLPNIFVGVCVRKLCDIAEVQDLLLEQ